MTSTGPRDKIPYLAISLSALNPTDIYVEAARDLLKNGCQNKVGGCGKGMVAYVVTMRFGLLSAHQGINIWRPAARTHRMQ